MTTTPPRDRASRPVLSDTLTHALGSADVVAIEALAAVDPVDDRDAALALLQLHDLHVLPLSAAGSSVRLQHHPAVSALKWKLDTASWIGWRASSAATGRA